MEPQWGKLTSLNPNFSNICLPNNKNSSNVYKCRIYKDEEDVFIQFTGAGLSVRIEDQVLKENEVVKVHSGEKIVLIFNQQQEEIRMEYVFSSELLQEQRDSLKRDREESEEIEVLEKKVKLNELLKRESKCILCCKMIYECVSVVPCLHSFCMYCVMQHLTGSQECPQCGERFTELRKNVFLNNIIEAYEESGYRKDRSQQECMEIRNKEKLETEIVFARFEYANGKVYEGEWKRCRKDGRGQMIDVDGDGDGDVYEGDWKNNKKEGKGKIFAQGYFYEGDIKNGKVEGKGKMILPSGAVYEGGWKNNKWEGKGQFVFGVGHIYEGDFKDGKAEGKGKMISTDGFIYEGDWKDSKKEGKGKRINSNGDIYEGNWEGNEMEGYGESIYANGDVYKGDWKRSLKEGKGKMTYKNGDFYEGDWKKDVPEGRGQMKYKEGDFYDGEFKKR